MTEPHIGEEYGARLAEPQSFQVRFAACGTDFAIFAEALIYYEKSKQKAIYERSPMKKLIFGLLLSVCCLSPASAKYSERVLRLDAELKQYQVRDNVLNMAQYQGSNLIDDKVYPDEQAGSDFVASLNELIQYYPRVIDLYHLIHEISESGYLGENQNLIISDLEYALKKVVDQGFGTGRFESWGFQQMPTYSPGDTMPDGEPCEDMRENVFYTTVQHGSGEMIFGVHLSAGSGYVSQEQFEIGNLHEACN